MSERLEMNRENKQTISYIIPCYNCKNTLESVIEELKLIMMTLKQYTYEIILVNDYSVDGTYALIKRLCYENMNLIGIDLSKNFGQHAALMAGFHYVTGEIIVCLDDDGQMPLEAVPQLINAIDNGADAVFGEYNKERNISLRELGSIVNAKMCEYLLDQPRNIQLTSFCAYKRFVVDEMIKYQNAYPYIAGLLLRTTKNIENIPVNHRKRVASTSGYTLKKLLSLWMNGFTAFSVKPLRFATCCGVICSLIGGIYAIITIIRKVVNPEILVGYSSIITILLFVGGMIMLMLGIVGEYIGRIYICINNSPQYVIKEVISKRVDLTVLESDRIYE